MIKKLLTLLAAGLLAVSMSMTAWAGEWIQDSNGWKYKKDSGYNAYCDWEEISGKWYYFGDDYYMKHDTVVGGYTLGADGAWDGNNPVVPVDKNKGNPLVPNYTHSFLSGGPNTEYYYINFKPMYKYKVNGSYLKNQWVRVYTHDGQWEGYAFVGNDGYSLTAGESRDGFTIDYSGYYTPRIYNGENGIRVWQDSASLCFHINAEGTTNWNDENRHDINCGIIDPGVASIRFDSADSNITPEGHYILITGYTYLPEMNTWIALGKDGEPKRYDFAYDTDFSLDFLGWLQTPEKLANYCKENDIIIQISVIDSLAQGDGSTGLEIQLAYANENSTKKSETPLTASDCCIH